MPTTQRDFILRLRSLTPAEDCLPDSVTKLFKLFEESFEVLSLEGGGTVNQGSIQPSPDDTDKPWIRTSTDGTPSGLFQFYGGVWNPMGFIVGMQVAYHGTAASVVAPWYVADGDNGTEDRSAEFTAQRIIIEFRGWP